MIITDVCFWLLFVLFLMQSYNFYRLLRAFNKLYATYSETYSELYAKVTDQTRN